jgi:hypothetical protein
MEFCSFQAYKGKLLVPRRGKESLNGETPNKLSKKLVRTIRYNYLHK